MHTHTSPHIHIDIWFDFVCPFCYLGERKLEMAITKFAEQSQIPVVLNFKSFQLNPSKEAIEMKGHDIHQIIADKYHISYDQAKANNDRIVASAKAVGLNYRFDLLKPSNTEKAHIMAQYVKKIAEVNHSNTIAQDLINRFYKAYFEEGANLDDEATLYALAEEVGLKGQDLAQHLNDPQLLAAVHSDQKQARLLGISGVPYFIVRHVAGQESAPASKQAQYTISGAQSVEHFLSALMGTCS